MTIHSRKSKFGLGARRFLRNQEGGAAVLFAGGLMMMVGVAAVTIDLGYLFVLKGKLQSTADAAVLAAAPQFEDEDAARVLALDYAAKNMAVGNHGTVLAAADVRNGTWHFRDKTFTPGATPPNALRVVARRGEENGNAVGLFFAQAMGFIETDVEVQAVVAQIVLNPPCIMSLDPTAGEALKVNNGTAIADGCGFHVNSNASNALDIALNGTLEADSICVRGGVTGNGDSDPSPQTGCPQVSDPLAAMVPPTYGGCDYSGNDAKFSNGTHTLSPGVYCGGISLSGSAKVTLLPGEYIIKGGSVKTTGSSTELEGDGVMLYFTDDAELALAGNGKVDLSAPTSGDYKGILFYGDPALDPDIKHSISGGANMTYDGVMYFPANEVNATGNGGGSTSAGNTVVIARLLKFSGNGSMTFKFDPAAPIPLPDDLAAMTTTTLLKLVY